jgi:hypothetical protein
MAIPINYDELVLKINEGWKKPQLAEHYGLPVAQMTKVLQQTGLKIRKFHQPKFVIVRTEVPQTDSPLVREEAELQPSFGSLMDEEAVAMEEISALASLHGGPGMHGQALDLEPNPIEEESSSLTEELYMPIIGEDFEEEDEEVLHEDENDENNEW